MSIISSELLLGAAGAAGGYEIERSLRFNSDNSSYLERTPSSNSNSQTFTLSWWIKRCEIKSSNKRVFAYTSGTNQFSVMFDSNGAFYTYFNLTAPADIATFTTRSVFRDPSAWYHFVMAFDTTQATETDRVKMWVNGVQITQFQNADYPRLNSLFYWNSTVPLKIGGYSSFYIDDYLAEIHSIDGQALDPTSFGAFDDNGVWQPKAYSGSYGTNGYHLDFKDNSTAAALGTDTSGNGNDWTVNNFLSNAVTVLYGEDVNDEGFDNNSTSLTLDTTGYSYSALTASPYQVSGQAAIARVIKSSDGSSFTATFTTTSSERFIWTSSNGINWSSPGTAYQTSSTPAVITAAWIAWAGGANAPTTSIEFNVPKDVDSLFDSPTNGTQTDTGAGGEVSGNYATLNPLQKAPSYSLPTLSNGNLDATSTGEQMCFSTIRVNSGKWYSEYTVSAISSTSDQAVRFADPSNINNQLARWKASGATNGLSGSPTFSSYTAGDVLGIAVNMDTLQAAFYKNGTQQGTGFYSLSNYTAGDYYLPGWYSSASGASGSFNFGQRPFAYTAPSGFKALCTANLPSTTITTSGSFTGNSSTDGPFIYLNGVPTAMTINSNSVTFGTHADKLSNGFKVRNSTSSYNQSGSNTYSITSTGDAFKNARAQTNP